METHTDALTFRNMLPNLMRHWNAHKVDYVAHLFEGEARFVIRYENLEKAFLLYVIDLYENTLVCELDCV